MNKIEHYQQERERIFLSWASGSMERDKARTAINALTQMIERIGIYEKVKHGNGVEALPILRQGGEG